MKIMHRLIVAIALISVCSARAFAQRVDGSGVRVNGVSQQSIAAAYIGNAFCLNLTTSDVYIARVGTNDIGFYTGATSCGVGGTPRFDVSATAVTSGVPVLVPNGSATNPGVSFALHTGDGLYYNGGPGLGRAGTGYFELDSVGFKIINAVPLAFSATSQGAADVFLVHSAAKTIRFDADGASGALTLVDVKGPLTVSGALVSGGNLTFGAGSLLQSSGRAIMFSPTTSAWTWRNVGQTAGFRIDIPVDGTAQCLADGGGDTCILKANVLNPTGAQQINGALLVSATAPTVSAGFGSAVAGTVTANTGTEVIRVTVGTNAGGTTGTLTFPAAPTGWACELHDVTTTTDLTRQTGFTTTTAAFSTTVAWTTGDVLVGKCGPF